MHAVIGGQLNDDLVVLVAEADALHVGAVVVPHLAQLQLHRHLRKQRTCVNQRCPGLSVLSGPHFAKAALPPYLKPTVPVLYRNIKLT